jgi:hypothetical protein
MSKAEAIDFVLSCLRSRLALASKATRETAEQAAADHGITAMDLLKRQAELNWRV